MDVVVIGHGPSTAGKRFGEKIDNCDCVVRIWENGWQSPEDYGTHYDIGVFTVWPNELSRFRKYVSRRPARWWAYDLRGMAAAGHVENLREPVEIMDPAPWNKLALSRGGKGSSGKFELTRGGMTALHAIKTLCPRRLFLIGFDAVCAGKTGMKEHNPAFVTAYGLTGVPDGPFPSGVRRTPTHDYKIEREIIVETGREENAEVLWSF